MERAAGRENNASAEPCGSWSFMTSLTNLGLPNRLSTKPSKGRTLPMSAVISRVRGDTLSPVISPVDDDAGPSGVNSSITTLATPHTLMGCSDSTKAGVRSTDTPEFAPGTF